MQLSHVLLIFFALFYLVKFVNFLFDTKPVKQQVTEKKKIQYWVNDKEIAIPHHEYYLKMLDLYGKKGINDETIARGASTILKGLKDNPYKLSAVDEMDIRSSSAFLMDQWSYFVMLN